MKQVVNKIPPSSLVLVENLDRNKFYGVTDPTHPNWKAFGMTDSYQYDLRGPCRLLSSHGFTGSNSFGHSSDTSLAELLGRLIHQGYIVYEFDRMSELALWLEKVEEKPEEL